jgi:predicted metal-dependent phosphoesterase TrpH
VIIDLHVHTAYSDDFEVGLDESIDKLRQRGISGLLLTECDMVPDLDEIQSVAKENDFRIFVGVEVEAMQGRFIGIPADPTQERFQQCAWLPEDGLPELEDVITFFHELDGLVIAVHPYLDDGEAFLGDAVFETKGLDALEILCGVRGHFPNDRALEAAASLNLPAIGGSDSGPKGERLGHFATVFADEVRTQQELIDAIRVGDAWPVEVRPAHLSQGRGQGRGRRDERR